MCGRFALITPPVRLARYFQATLADGMEPEAAPIWNVAPTTDVLAVRDRRPRDGGEPVRTLASYRWGLIPSWSDDPTAGNRLFNARSETLTTKPSFRAAFAQRRVIIPADGFYEWRAESDGSRQPHYFIRADGAPLAFAGLAEWWRDRHLPDGPVVHSCSIITGPAGPDMDGIHDRMPVILPPEAFVAWLDPDEDGTALGGLLRAAPAGTLIHHPVDRRVGNVQYNDAELIAPVAVAPRPAQATLWDEPGSN